MQPPPPGFPPQWGNSPNDPRGQVEPGYGSRPSQENYGQQPSAPGYATPPAGYGQQPGYGPPAWSNYRAPAPAPTSPQTVGWITFAVIGLLGLLGAILTLTLWINLTSAVSRASDVCNRYSGEYSSMCRQHIQSMVPSVPTVLAVCLFLVIGAGLAVSGGAVMLFLKRHLGQFLILGGGIVMLMLAIGCEARYGSTGRLTYDLIAGVVVAVTAGLMFVPAFRVVLGLPPKLVGGSGPGGFQGGGQWPYWQPPPPQYGPPGPGGQPPPQW